MSIELKTVPYVAKALTVSRSKVYQLMEQGQLTYVKLGKSRRVPLEAVEELIARSTVPAHA